MNGFIYILVNASMPGLLKIGQSVRVPEDRAAELSQPTGVPVPYVVAWFEKVSDCVQAERSLHKQLHEYRCNQNREFFYLPLRDAIEVAMQVAEQFPDSADSSQGGGKVKGQKQRTRGLWSSVKKIFAPTYQLSRWEIRRDVHFCVARVTLHGKSLFTNKEGHTETIELILLPDETEADLVRCAVEASENNWHIGLWQNITKFGGRFGIPLNEQLAATIKSDV